MIGEINRGTDIYDLVSYVCQEEKKAQRVYGNFWEAIAPELNIKSIAKQFNDRAVLNRRVKKPFYHVSISPSYEEASQMDAIGWSEIAEEFVKKMNLEQNLVMGVVHNDTYFPNTNKPRPHLHLIVNTVNVETNKCADTYYDYFLVENLLRDFEEDLFRKREAERKLESESNNVAKESEVEKNHNDDFKAQEKNKSLLPELEKLDELADKIGTQENNINGLDVTAYTITSISSLAKIAALFLEKAQSQKDASQLNELIGDLEELKKLNPQQEMLKLPGISIDEVSVRCLPQFVSDAQQSIEEAIKLLPPEKLNEEKNTNSIFDRFLNYFHAIDDLNSQPNKEQYRVKGKALGEVALDNSPESKKISIKVDEEIIYKSEFENQKQQWLTPVDCLEERQKELIDKLPQSPSEVRKKQLEMRFADHLNRLFDRDKAPSTIACQFKTGALEFDRLKFSDGTSEIRGFELAKGNLIFNAKISPNKAISVSKNQISTERLEEFARFMKQNHPSQSQSSHFKKNKSR